jgi:alanine racemase
MTGSILPYDRWARRRKMKLSRRQFMMASTVAIPSFYSNKSVSTSSRIRQKAPSFEKTTLDAWIELNLENMAWNLDKISRQVRVPVMAVIKANGYGHGVVEVGRFLDEAGIDALMVCRLSEAVRLREAGVQCPILNFGPLFPEDADILAGHDISQSIFTDQAEALSQRAQILGDKIKVHIHIDTGMGRMGIPYYEALPYIIKTAALEGLLLEGISTTLTEDPAFDMVQMEQFLTLCRKAEEKGIRLGLKHACSSAGIFTGKSFYLDMIRPGIVLYGYYPNQKTQQEDFFSLKPLLQLKSRVAAVKKLRPGDSVSYHRAYKATVKEKIAVVPVGYSDGYPFQVIGKGFVLIRGLRFPVIGDITANHLEVRLPHDSPISVGDEVVLIGTQGREKIQADEVASWAGFSTYKILLRLNPLLPRIVL